MAVRIVSGVLALASLFVLTRLMDAGQYGLYALGLASVNIGAAVGFQWLAVALARFYPAHADHPSLLLSTVRRIFLVLVAGSGLLAVMLVAAGSVFSIAKGLDAPMIALVWAGLVSMAWQNLHLQTVNARGLPLRYGLISATRTVVTLVCAVAILQFTSNSAAALAATVLGCLVAVWLFGSRNPRPQSVAVSPPASTAGLTAHLLRYGFPLSLTYVAVMVVDQSDRFFIAWWSGAAAVAGYAAAYDLAQQTAGALLNVFFLAHYPKVTTAWEQGGALAARKAMEPLARGLLLASPLVVGVFAGLAPEIATTMFGPSLRPDATTVLPWIALAVTVGGLRAFFFDIAFHVKKDSLTQLKVVAAMAVVNLTLNLALIPRMGVLGAAISTTVAMMLGAVASAWCARRVAICPPVGLDLCKAALLALLLMWVLRGTGGWDAAPLGWLLRLGSALLLYVLTVWVVNLAGMRALVAMWLSRRGSST